MPRTFPALVVALLVVLPAVPAGAAAKAPPRPPAKAPAPPAVPEVAVVGLDLVETAEGPLRVRRILMEGAAYRAGIREGDTIDQVDGADVSGQPAAAVAERIRGPKGTEVVLRVNGKHVVRVVRSLAAKDGAAAWRREMMRPFEVRIAELRSEIAALDRKLAKPIVPEAVLRPFAADVAGLGEAWREQAARVRPQVAAAGAANPDLPGLTALAEALGRADHPGVVEHGRVGKDDGDREALRRLVASPAWMALPPEIWQLRDGSRLLRAWDLAAAGDFAGAREVAETKDGDTDSSASPLKARAQALAPRLAKAFGRLEDDGYWRKRWREDRARHLEDLTANQEVLERFRRQAPR